MIPMEMEADMKKVTNGAGRGQLKVRSGGEGQPAAMPRWTDDDEFQLRAMLDRRRAAGYRKPSRDVGGQVLKLGSFGPNPNTVTASICAIIGLHGTITRGELLAEMAETVFPHPKAQPKNPKWCQDWVAGVIRNGFVVVVEGDQSTGTDTAAQTPVRVHVSDLKLAEV